MQESDPAVGGGAGNQMQTNITTPTIDPEGGVTVAVEPRRADSLASCRK